MNDDPTHPNEPPRTVTWARVGTLVDETGAYARVVELVYSADGGPAESLLIEPSHARVLAAQLAGWADVVDAGEIPDTPPDW